MKTYVNPDDLQKIEEVLERRQWKEKWWIRFLYISAGVAGAEFLPLDPAISLLAVITFAMVAIAMGLCLERYERPKVIIGRDFEREAALEDRLTTRERELFRLAGPCEKAGCRLHHRHIGDHIHSVQRVTSNG